MSPGHYSKGKPYAPNEYAKTRRAALVELFGGKCESCGALFPLEFAHVKETELNGRGRGRKERQSDISLHRDAYLLLCDPEHLTLTRIEEREKKLAGSREAALALLKAPSDKHHD